MLSPISKRGCSKQKMCRRGHGLLDGFRDLSLVESSFSEEREITALCQKRSTVWRGCDDGSLGDDSNSSDSNDNINASVDDTCLWEIFMSSDLSPHSKNKENRIPKMSTPSSTFKRKSKAQNGIYKYFSLKDSPVQVKKKNKKCLVFSSGKKSFTASDTEEKNDRKFEGTKLIPKKLSLQTKNQVPTKNTSPFTSPSRKCKQDKYDRRKSHERRIKDRSRSPINKSASKSKVRTLPNTPSPKKLRFSTKDASRVSYTSQQTFYIKNVKTTVSVAPSTKKTDSIYSNTLCNSITSSKVSKTFVTVSPIKVYSKKLPSSSTRKFNLIKKAVTEPRLKRKMESSPQKQNVSIPKKRCKDIDLNLSKSCISFSDIFKSLEAEKNENSKFKPIKTEKECKSCGCIHTPVWRETGDGVTLCNSCGIRWRSNRVRCMECWYIPMEAGDSNLSCTNCGSYNSIKECNRLRRFASSIY